MSCYILLRQKPSPLLNFEFPQNYEAISRTKGFNGKKSTKGRTKGKTANGRNKPKVQPKVKLPMLEINQR